MSKLKKNLSVSGLLFVAFAFHNNQVTAQQDWINTTNTNASFHLASNWSDGAYPDPTERARFGIGGEAYEVWWTSISPVLLPSVAVLHVVDGDITFLNIDDAEQHELLIHGNGGNSFTNFEIRPSASLTNRGIHLHSLGGAVVKANGTLNLDGSHSNGARLTVDGFGLDVSGNLNVLSGGIVDNTTGYIGRDATSTGIVTVSGTGSQWNNTQGLFIGDLGDGEFNIFSGGSVSTGSGRLGNATGSTGTLNLSGTDSSWASQTLTIGMAGNGILNLTSGAIVNSNSGTIGSELNSSGVANISGTGSEWTSSSLYVGQYGNGQLTVSQKGKLSTGFGYLGTFEGSTGSVTVQDAGSEWTVSLLVVGLLGNGTLNVESAGAVLSENGNIGGSGESSGVVTVTGTNSQWINYTDLEIGVLGGNGMLNIDNGGTIVVGGRTTLGTTGTVNLNAGRFEFGQTNFPDFNRINATSGTLTGNVIHRDYTDVDTLSSLQNGLVDSSGVLLINSGTLFGNASLGNSLSNTADGEVETISGERMRFAGAGNANLGEINNFGGIIRFEQDLTNQAGGFVGGRGQFIANGGWTNEGVMAFSGGPVEILGDVEIQSSGQIVTSGGATTTFYDDVIHNGSEIRTAAGSSTVFFGGVTGAGSYTGTGTVFYEGDLRPGNSPAIVDYEGDVVFGSAASSIIELGGWESGQFDQLAIEGDLFLDGSLTVELIDGFQLGSNDLFLIVDVGGLRNGQYTGLSEGSLVGNFGGRGLFISYGAGDGNDVALFTSVPEPGTFGFAALVVLVSLVRRRR